VGVYGMQDNEKRTLRVQVDVVKIIFEVFKENDKYGRKN
jgi:hypothetical protein